MSALGRSQGEKTGPLPRPSPMSAARPPEGANPLVGGSRAPLCGEGGQQ